MVKQLLRLMTELSSHRWLSRLMGAFSHSRLSRFLIPTFIRTYHIPAAEAEKPSGEYHTLNEFFSRRLKSGMRQIADSAGAVASPVDALITAMGEIHSGTIMNVKGRITCWKSCLTTHRIRSFTRRAIFSSCTSARPIITVFIRRLPDAGLRATISADGPIQSTNSA